jgi:hypothetical protein
MQNQAQVQALPQPKQPKHQKSKQYARIMLFFVQNLSEI